jgi:RNA polymerase sigma-54 factor
MALELKQTVKLSQQLVMTPQLQQAIRLLQLSTLELRNVVEQELVENPCLEEAQEGEDAPTNSGERNEEPGSSNEEQAAGSDGADRPAEPSERQNEGPETFGDGSEEFSAAGVEESEFGAGALPEGGTAEPERGEVVSDVDWENYMEARPHTSLGRADEDRPALEDNLTRARSLADHLIWQLGFLELDDAEQAAGMLIIGNLKDDGYLDEDLEVIAREAGLDLERAEALLLRIQEFDPVGVAARNLGECLLVQARVAKVDDPLVLKIIREHLNLLQKKDFRGIARREDVSPEEVAQAARVISNFEPRPGRQFAGEDPIYITPDIFVHKVGDEFHVVLNEDGLPMLRVSSAYREVLSRKGPDSKETRDYVREKLRSAVWLIKSIHQRQRTIVRVTESIVRFQHEFFGRGSEYLRPLNLRDVAEDIGMHESTVSRVTSNKYVQTPHGLFELKFFFNSSIQKTDGGSIASESVKEKIRDIIRREDSGRPLSDQQIAEVLRMSSIHIARRTVTKYREYMRILPSTRRRKIS